MAQQAEAEPEIDGKHITGNDNDDVNVSVNVGVSGDGSEDHGLPIVRATPVVRTEQGYFAADQNGQPHEPIPSDYVVRARQADIDSSINSGYSGSGRQSNNALINNRRNNVADRNCCENRACLYTFWLIIGVFVLGSFVLGFLTNRPWLGALSVLSIIPAVIILYFVYWKDSRQQVDLPRVVNMFTWGVVGAIPCAILELFITMAFTAATGYNTRALDNPEKDGQQQQPVSQVILYAFFAAFVVAALCEETLKYLLVAAFPGGTKGLRTPYGIVILACTGALGFATIENINYVFEDDSSTAALGVAAVRALLAVPLHACTGILIGLGIAKAIMSRQTPVYWKIIWLPVLLHGTYDATLMMSAGLSSTDPWTANLAYVAFFIPILGFSYAVHCINKLPPEYFTGEENRGLLAGGRR